jgi:hypothetical protein
MLRGKTGERRVRINSSTHTIISSSCKMCRVVDILTAKKEESDIEAQVDQL